MRKALALIVALWASPSVAQQPAPPGLYPIEVPFQLFCADSLEFMIDLLAKDWKEAPVMLSHQTDNSTIIFFTNLERTTSTLVMSRMDKVEGETACIVFTGQSGEGFSFSINPSPDFPEGNKL